MDEGYDIEKTYLATAGENQDLEELRSRLEQRGFKVLNLIARTFVVESDHLDAVGILRATPGVWDAGKNKLYRAVGGG